MAKNQNIRNRFSLYWRYQLWGWLLYVLIILIFAWINKEFFVDASSIAPLVIRVFILGLLISHVMRTVIKRLKILELPFSQQGFYFFLLTISFSLLFIIILNLTFENFGLLGDITKATNQILNGIFFMALLITGSLLVWNLVYFIIHYVQRVRREEEQKASLRIQMLELEAHALRAQMNPHFIFNCLNSIKSLMLEKEIDKGVSYLITFSKLIRTLFNNADKKEISLFDEIETCRLYLQLEAVRFDTKFSYTVSTDGNLDMKSVLVPALIVQPFIENSIWHGIVPGGMAGKVELKVIKQTDGIDIIVEDDGIGREASMRNNSASNFAHQSKGVNLTQSRLKLDNLLQQRQASIETIDKKNEKGIAMGTKVILKIKEEL